MTANTDGSAAAAEQRAQVGSPHRAAPERSHRDASW